MAKRIHLFAAILIVAVSMAGCMKIDRPDGLPPLFPCSITVTQGGMPVKDVKVAFYDTAISNKWSISGLTDGSGVAIMRTHGQFPGAPSGTFKVVLAKTVSEGAYDGDETKPVIHQPVRVYTMIEKQYLQEDSTPLEIEIKKKRVSKSYEIGEPVRILIATVAPGDV